MIKGKNMVCRNKVRIPFTEPVSPRYIHINAATNQIHLLVPVVGGLEISTDNTCKVAAALREFFDGEALRELTSYKDALALDIALIDTGNPQREAKEARLVQIEAYIEAVSAMRHSYGNAITALLARPSNLYSIQLRPHEQDSQSRVVNPAFTIERKNNTKGTPLSSLYNAMYRIFPGVAIVEPDPRTRLTAAVLSALPPSPGFEDIQRVLEEQCVALYKLSIDFTKESDSTAITRDAINALMRFEGDATPQDYIDALLGVCAPNVWNSIPISPFNSIPAGTSIYERTERFSILTQFFLANINVYCKARGISTQNFGIILDTSSDLSQELVDTITTALTAGDDVEMAICTFCNANADKFKLSRSLNAEAIAVVKQKFERTYFTVTATKENPHMDDFMILDKEATGETAIFVTHQGSICVDFADMVDAVAASANPGYFARIRADFATHPAEIPHGNEAVAGEIEVDIETLLTGINDEQFARLPQAVKDVCRAHSQFQLYLFLDDVAKGRQEEAQSLLTATADNTQSLLRTPGIFTDYSGRAFNCTAYEYAYWAKDTHMRRMLESYMDEETKALMWACVTKIESVGIEYQQNSEILRTKSFDLTPLKQALQQYVDGFKHWANNRTYHKADAALHVVGKFQRDVPAHIAQEYCRPDRSFYPTPQFNEDALPRTLTFYNTYNTHGSPYDFWFSSRSSTINSGLDSNFALTRCDNYQVRGVHVAQGSGTLMFEYDLAAITHLDEVRTAELILSRDYLNPPVQSCYSENVDAVKMEYN